MQSNFTNIYKKARTVAGLTQERAAELLGISVRSLADYELGVRLPSDVTAYDMVVVYNSQLLGIQHLRQSAAIANSLIPEIRDMQLPEAVLTLIDAIYDFSDDKMDRELIDIARDGVIDEKERARFDRIMDKLRAILGAAMTLNCSAVGEGNHGDT